MTDLLYFSVCLFHCALSFFCFVCCTFFFTTAVQSANQILDCGTSSGFFAVAFGLLVCWFASQTEQQTRWPLEWKNSRSCKPEKRKKRKEKEFTRVEKFKFLISAARNFGPLFSSSFSFESKVSLAQHFLVIYLCCQKLLLLLLFSTTFYLTRNFLVAVCRRAKERVKNQKRTERAKT